MWIIFGAPSGSPTPYCPGCRISFPRGIILASSIFAINRRKVSPTAIGRTPSAPSLANLTALFRHIRRSTVLVRRCLEFGSRLATVKPASAFAFFHSSSIWPPFQICNLSDTYALSGFRSFLVFLGWYNIHGAIARIVDRVCSLARGPGAM